MSNQLSTWMANTEIKNRIGSALGGWMEPDDFIAQVLIAFQDPKVQACKPDSLFAAAHTCASMQLLPSLGQVALIPYKGTCKVMPQWQGYQALMLRNPEIQDVRAYLVHKVDTYSMEVGNFCHHFDPFNPDRQFKIMDDLQGGYLLIEYKDGRPNKHHFVHKQTFVKARQCAQSDNIWNKWLEQMLLKTIYRDAYARRAVPIDPLVNKRLEDVTAQDDLILENNPERVASPQLAPVATQTTGQKILGLMSKPPQEAPPEPQEETPAVEYSGPTVPPELEAFRALMLEATAHNDIENLYMEHVGTNENLTEDGYNAGQAFYEWRLLELGYEVPLKGGLFE